MGIFTQYQAKLLADFCSDIAKGALLAALGFSIVTPTEVFLKLTFSLGGIFTAAIFLYWALGLAREVSFYDKH